MLLWCHKADEGLCYLPFKCGQGNKTAYLSSHLNSATSSFPRADSDFDRSVQMAKIASFRNMLEDEADPDLWEFAKERALNVLSSHDKRNIDRGPQSSKQRHHFDMSMKLNSYFDQEHDQDSSVTEVSQSSFSSGSEMSETLVGDEDENDAVGILSVPFPNVPSRKETNYGKYTYYYEGKISLETQTAKTETRPTRFQKSGFGARHRNMGQRTTSRGAPRKFDRQWEVGRSSLLDPQLIGIMARRKQSYNVQILSSKREVST